MRSLTLCLLFTLPFLLTSCCTGTDNARIRYILNHPALSVDVRNAIAHGELAKGMRCNDVRASWGKPDSVTEGMRVNNEEITRWIYVKRMGPCVSVSEVTFVDGVISEMESYSQKNVYRYVAGENYEPSVVK